MKRFGLALLTILAILGMVTLAVPRGGMALAQPITVSGEPVLLELFTSQGCSSCPPADRLAARIADRPGLVVISRPVDYWDRLGWKDTFARPQNSALQRAYSRRGLAGQNGVYTPQIVVNGAFGAIGSHEAAVASGVQRGAGKRPAAIRVRDLGPNGFAIGLAGQANRPAELVLVAVSRREVVNIGRGENGGREVTYTNVLRDERRLSGWNGGRASYRITPDQLRTDGANRFGLVLREPDGGPVLAARWLDQ